MNCCQFERRLQQLLDDRAEKSLHTGDLPKRMRSHTSECADCMELLDGYRALFSTLATTRFEPALFPAEAVVQRITPVRGRGRWLRAVVSLATAASILLAAFAVYYRGEPETAELVTIAPPTSNASAPTLPTEVVLTGAEDAALSRVFFASPLEIDERSLGLMLNLAGLSPVTLSAELFDSPLVARREWVMQVTDGLKPVAERMTGTLNTLLQVLPRAEAQQDPTQGARYDRYRHYGRLT